MCLLPMTNEFVHECNVVKRRQMAVFYEGWSIVWRQCFHELIDDFIWDERVTEVDFRDVWLFNIFSFG